MAAYDSRASGSSASNVSLAQPRLDGGEYEESDSEEMPALPLRRREASDDEENDRKLRGAGLDQASSGDDDKPRHLYSDYEVEGEGAPAIDDGEEESDDDVEPAANVVRQRMEGRKAEDDDVVDDDDEQHSKGKAQTGTLNQSTGILSKDAGADEKKDAEPFVVPTAGAFYMHDDRFRDNGGARPRRNGGGRKLWEAKDQKPWVHDRFEELSLHKDRLLGKGQRGRGERGRGRGQGRGIGSGYVKSRGDRIRSSEYTGLSYSRRDGEGQGSRSSRIDDHGTKGPSTAPRKITVQASQEIAASSNIPPQPAVKQTESLPTKKPGSGSLLNSASPPFYPSGSLHPNLAGQVIGSGKLICGVNEGREREVQQGGKMGIAVKSPLRNGIAMLNISHTAQQFLSSGNVTNSVNPITPAEVDGSLHASIERGQTTPQQVVKTVSASMLQQQQSSKSETKAQLIVDQPLVASTLQKTSKASSEAQPSSYVRQPPLQVSKQGHLSLQQSAPQISKQGHHLFLQQPAQTSGANQPTPSSLDIDLVNASSSLGNKLKSTGSGKASRESSLQVGGGSYVFNGGHAGGLTSGLRSVVQYAGQPQPGLGVPAVGMALPGYSSPPQFGFGNSEVTWVPILAGGGAMGTSYGSPFIAVDGATSAVYYTQATAQPASFNFPGRESNDAKPTGVAWKPTSRSEIGSDESGQRQNKPRRYSEMNFGQ